MWTGAWQRRSSLFPIPSIGHLSPSLLIPKPKRQRILRNIIDVSKVQISGCLEPYRAACLQNHLLARTKLAGVTLDVPASGPLPIQWPAWRGSAWSPPGRARRQSAPREWEPASEVAGEEAALGGCGCAGGPGAWCRCCRHQGHAPSAQRTSAAAGRQPSEGSAPEEICLILVLQAKGKIIFALQSNHLSQVQRNPSQSCN